MQDGLTGQWITDATVTVCVRDSDGATVIEPITCQRDTATVATYRGTIDDRLTAVLQENVEYYVEATAVWGTATGFRRVSRKARRYAARSIV